MLLATTILVLTILCIQAGHDTTYLQKYPIISIDTSALKSAYEKQHGQTPAIHDVYKIFIKTYCYGDYPVRSDEPLVNFHCSHPSSYSKFKPADQINSSLNLDLHHSNATVDDMPFFPEAQAQFTGKFNLQLHVAFIFYVLGAVWTGIACLVSLFAIWWGLLGYVVVFLISSATTCLLISSAIVTAVQDQAVMTLNIVGEEAGVHAFGSPGILRLTWTAYALSFLDTIAWSIATNVRDAVAG